MIRQLFNKIKWIGKDAVRSYGFFLRNCYATKRKIKWFLTSLVYATISDLAVIYIGVAANDKDMTINLFIGAMIWTYLSTIFEEISLSITYERWEGTIEYSFGAPVSRVFYLLSISIFAVVIAFLKLLVLLLVCIPLFGISMSMLQFSMLMAVLVVSTFSFIGFGSMAASLPLVSVEAGAQAAYIIQGLLLLISGVYYPVTIFPKWVQFISQLSPATYTINACRKIFLGNMSILYELEVLMAVSLLFIPLGFYIFYLAEIYTKHTGGLKRNG